MPGALQSEHGGPMDILIVADDLSGAADCAIAFARTGQRAVVALQPSAPEADVILSVDADTRRLPAAEAVRRTREVYEGARRQGQKLYKKIDSTLRGNWAAEVAALRQPAGMAIVACAYPAMGRTVRGAQVYVDGRALADTELWKLEHAHRPAAIDVQLQEAGLQTATLDTDALCDRPEEMAARITAAATRGLDALIVDAQSEQSLRTLAQVTADSELPFFWVGSAGLAREIAGLRPSRAAPELAPASGPTLVLVGSLSAVTERQCRVVRASGALQDIVAPPSLLRQGRSHPGWPTLHARIGEVLGAGADLLLRIGREQALDPSEGALLAAALARLVGPHFARIGALIATGGETARAMLVEAGIDSVELLAELQPGVAAGMPSRDHAHRPYIVTKAGGFGSDETLYDAWTRLQAPRSRTPE